MEMIEEGGSAAGSPTASTDVSTTQPAAQSQESGTQAGTQQQEPPFHQHPRFRELTAANREMKQQIAALIRAQQQSQQTPGQAQVVSSEEQQAIVALKRLIGNDPELKAILELAKNRPQLEQRFQGLDQFQARAAQAHNASAKTHIRDLATAANLPVDDASLRHIVRLVAGEAMSLEGGNERYSSGDMSVLDEAFKALEPWLSAMRKPAEQSLAQTKNKLKGMPQPLRTGSQAGQPAAPKLEEGKEREYEANLHKRAGERLRQLLQG